MRNHKSPFSSLFRKIVRNRHERSLFLWFFKAFVNTITKVHVLRSGVNGALALCMETWLLVVFFRALIDTVWQLVAGKF